MFFGGNESEVRGITRKISLAGTQQLFYFAVLFIDASALCPGNSHGFDSCLKIPDPVIADLFAWLCG